MSNVVVCSCGKSLRAHEGMAEFRCPVCDQVTYLASSVHAAGPQAVNGRTASADSIASEIVLFGFDPPEASVPKVHLQYQVVEVSSETVPVRPGKVRDDDDDDRPYRLDQTTAPRDGLPTQEEMWGPDIDLRADRNSSLPLRKRRRLRRPGEWTLEKNWHECLAYPVRGWPLLAALGFALTFATFGLLQAWRDDGQLGWFFCLIGSLALCYSCGFLTCVLNAGASGDAAAVRWPGGNLKILLESLLAASLSFLAGPIIPAAVGVYFWVYSGNITVIDYLILFELFVVTFGYWLLVFFSVSLCDDWSSLLPGAVIARARQLGIGKTLSALGIVTVIFLFHGFFSLAGLENQNSVSSFILLLFCWTSLLFWMVFLMRWLGVSMYRIRKAQKDT